jgi:transglutaminase-like putative cysteine protease
MKLSASVIYRIVLVVLMVSAPHAEHLPIWVSAVCVMLLAWRAYLNRASLPLPRRWLLLLITFGSTVGVAVEYHTLFGREAGITLLILLAALKLLELRSQRDGTLVIYLACFIVITNFLYSQSIPTALFMLVTLLVIVATWLQLQSPTMNPRPRLRLAAILLVQAVPLMLVLFILFPRVQGPLWGMPQDAYASSGLTDSMAPGSISQLSLSDAVAFRVNFHGKAPPRDLMYWRGPVLWEFDGRMWTPGRVGGTKPAQLDNLAMPVEYTVTLEPHNKTWLFALEMPTRVSVPATVTYDFQLRQRRPVTSRIRYDLRSELSYRANLQEEPLQLRRALQVPTGINPRARQLAEGWRAASKNPEAIMQHALGYFNQQGFGYTLEPPQLPPLNGIDAFLFESKLGFCEHFSSAFVFLMRSAGVPARVVTGYQGAQYNALGDYYIVRQSDAHAWAEVWLEGRGWVRVDPTAAVSPARVQNGLAAAVPDTAALPFFERNPPAWLLRLRFNLDMLAFRWSQWVLGYDAERQFAFLSRLGMSDISWQKLALQLTGSMAALIALFALIMLRRMRTHISDPALAVYLKFCRKLAKHGIVRAAHEGPQDFAIRAAQLKPELATAISDITARYVALRYREQPSDDALRALRRAVAEFKL